MSYKIKENKMLNEKHYSFKHKSGLEVYVFPKEMTTSYAILATRYGAVDNKFKLASDKEFTCVPDGIAHFLEHKLLNVKMVSMHLSFLQKPEQAQMHIPLIQ